MTSGQKTLTKGRIAALSSLDCCVEWIRSTLTRLTIRGSLDPREFVTTNGISIALAILSGLTNVTNRPTNRPTDHATPSVAIARFICNACDAT